MPLLQNVFLKGLKSRTVSIAPPKDRRKTRPVEYKHLRTALRPLVVTSRGVSSHVLMEKRRPETAGWRRLASDWFPAISGLSIMDC